MIPSDGESKLRVNIMEVSERISPSIRALGIEIHRHVEKAVDKVVDNNRKSSNASILYLIA
jgi:hypothetical protein